jgi:NADH-quinone oxidoreductase subunit L
MVLPLVALAVPAVLSGLADLPWSFLGISAHWMTEFLGGHGERFSISVAAISSAVGAAGIVTAYLMYVRKSISAEAVGSRFRPLHVLFTQKYYMDHLYESLFTVKFLHGGLARSLDWFDANVVDRGANTLGWVGRNFGRVPAQLQTGQTQFYGAVFTIGLVLVLGAFWVWG